MKVIAKKSYHNRDLYHYPDENVSYGLFPFNKGESYPVRKDIVIIHKKGDFKEWKFEIEKYCCKKIKETIGREEIIFRNFYTHTKKTDSPMFTKPGVFINCSCWSFAIGIYQIEYCPFCGEKIEIEEKK